MNATRSIWQKMAIVFSVLKFIELAIDAIWFFSLCAQLFDINGNDFAFGLSITLAGIMAIPLIAAFLAVPILLLRGALDPQKMGAGLIACGLWAILACADIVLELSEANIWSILALTLYAFETFVAWKVYSKG